MSGLAFLTPDAPEGSATARTPMERVARAAGARFERRGRWNVAVDYGDQATERQRLAQAVGFADRSQLLKLELQAQPGTLATIVREASDGLTLRAGVAGRSRGAWWCPVTPSRALVLAEPGAAAGELVRTAVCEAAALAAASGSGGAPASVTIAEVTCGLAALALVGPGAGELLARFCAIDARPAVTPVGGFRPGSIARTPGYLLRAGEDELLVLVGWALGEYLWQVVADAAERLGGSPVGADALAEHLGGGPVGADERAGRREPPHA